MQLDPQDFNDDGLDHWLLVNIWDMEPFHDSEKKEFTLVKIIDSLAELHEADL